MNYIRNRAKRAESNSAAQQRKKKQKLRNSKSSKRRKIAPRFADEIDLISFHFAYMRLIPWQMIQSHIKY